MNEGWFDTLWTYAPVILLLLAAFIAFGPFFRGKPKGTHKRVERRIRAGGMDRTFILYLPHDVKSRSDWRVIIAYHPALCTGAYMEAHTRFHAIPGAENFIVAYPDGYGRTWNAGTCCGPAMKQGIDDVGFFDAMLRDIAKQADIREKAYVAGFSNGALMGYYLTCMRNDRLAAVASFGAYLPPETLAEGPDGPVPLLHIHGDADPGAPVDGGMTNYLGELPPAIDTVRFLAKRGGCDVTSPRSLAVPELDTVCVQYAGASAEAEANFCVVPGLGHVWPGSEQTMPQFGPARPELEGSKVILEFFLNH